MYNIAKSLWSRGKLDEVREQRGCRRGLCKLGLRQVPNANSNIFENILCKCEMSYIDIYVYRRVCVHVYMCIDIFHLFARAKCVNLQFGILLTGLGSGAGVVEG